MNKHSFTSQSIGMCSIANARELGGFVMKDGRRVRHGLLLRGGSLANASDEDLSRLEHEFNVRCIFDFRTDTEARREPDRQIPGTEYYRLPTMDPINGRRAKQIFEDVKYDSFESLVIRSASVPMVQQYCRELYTSMVANEYSQLQYASFIQGVIELDSGAVYWHCRQGKDRTGLGSALLLAALGADRETILEDFEISNEFYRNDVESLMPFVGTGPERKAIQTLIGVSVDYFIDALNLIDSLYGSMDNYLSNMLVLSEPDLERLRSRILE